MRSSDIDIVLVEARRQFWLVAVVALVTTVVILLDRVGGPLVAGLGLASMAFAVRQFKFAIVLQNARRGGEHNRCHTDGDGRANKSCPCCRECLPASQVPVTDQWSSEDEQCLPTRPVGDDVLDGQKFVVGPDRPDCCNRDRMNVTGTNSAATHTVGLVETRPGTDADHGDRCDRQEESTSDRSDSGR